MISIIIPAYNAEKTIARCLKSILAQSYQDFEVIVVNDGSTDNTLKNIDSTIARLRNRAIKVRVVSQENRGAQAARNRGWREVQKHTTPNPSSERRGNDLISSPYEGEVRRGLARYVLFCDADLVLRRDCLEKMVRALEKHPEASYAYSSFKFGWKKFKLWPFDAEKLREIPYIHTTSLIRYSAIVGLSPKEARAKPLGPFDESIKRLQDWDLWLTMLEQGHIGIWIPEVLFHVISTKGTMSSWLPSFAYKIPKWLGIQPKAVARYNEAVARIKEKHNLV